MDIYGNNLCLIQFSQWLWKLLIDSLDSVDCAVWDRWMCMTTLAGGFLVTKYHDAGHKVSKSNLD